MRLILILHSLSRPVRLTSPAFTRRGFSQRMARGFSEWLVTRKRRTQRQIAAANSSVAFGQFGFADVH